MLKPLLITILALAVVAAVVFVGGKYWGEKATDETAGWQTYRNEEYGFEISYPPGWSIIKTGDKFINIENGPLFVSIQVLVGEKVSNPENVKNTATFHDGENSIFISDAFFTADSPTRKFEQIDESLFNQILSTFKFTGGEKTIETAGQTLFRNEYFGFEITLPEGWQVRNVSLPGVAFEFVSPPNDTGSIKRIVFAAESVDPSLISGLKVVETINGIRWEVYVEQGIVDFLNYETQRYDRIYRFQFTSAVDSPEYLQQLREIISTFRFIK